MDLPDRLKNSQYPLPPHLKLPSIMSIFPLARCSSTSWPKMQLLLLLRSQLPGIDTKHEVPLLQLHICSTNLIPIGFQWQYHKCTSEGKKKFLLTYFPSIRIFYQILTCNLRFLFFPSYILMYLFSKGPVAEKGLKVHYNFTEKI